jgi:hypothetical protein
MQIIAHVKTVLDGLMIGYCAAKLRGRISKSAVDTAFAELADARRSLEKTCDYVDEFDTVEALRARVDLFYADRRIDKMEQRYTQILELAAQDRLIIIW